MKPVTFRQQRGMAMVLTVIALVSILGVLGLALDGGHAFLSKTRLQNAVDAAALSAARTLDQTADTSAASGAADTAFAANANSPELAQALAGGDIALQKQFSSTLVPFVPGSTPPTFVRVVATGLDLDAWLVQIVGTDQLSISASAVAGPSPSLNGNVCDIAPMIVCAVPDDPDDPTELFGYPVHQTLVLKHGSNQDSDIGNGNFQLARLPGGQGGSQIREASAGGYESETCLSENDVIETEPGNTVGPLVQGINTRFGEYSGGLSADEYPGDFVTNAPDPQLRLDGSGNIEFEDGSAYNTYTDMSFHYGDYETGYPDCSVNPAQCHRRIITIAMGDCSETVSGQGEVPILGFSCMYLIQPVQQQGIEAHVFGQIVDKCDANGSFQMAPGAGPAPTKIVLYKDPGSVDS